MPVIDRSRLGHRTLYLIPMLNTIAIVALTWPHWVVIPIAILQALAVVLALQSAWHDGRASAFREALEDFYQRFGLSKGGVPQ